MSRIAPITAHHPSILECLGVLQLIADRMEAGDFVDPQDVSIVLEFLRDVGCECLADTEKLYQLTQELKAEVARSNKDTLSVAVVKKAQEVERLAKSIKERSRGQ